MVSCVDQVDVLLPIIDPEMYRDYMHQGAGEIVRGVLEAALEYKQATEKPRKYAQHFQTLACRRFRHRKNRWSVSRFYSRHR
jgi:hypothetical protein